MKKTDYICLIPYGTKFVGGILTQLYIDETSRRAYIPFVKPGGYAGSSHHSLLNSLLLNADGKNDL